MAETDADPSPSAMEQFISRLEDPEALALKLIEESAATATAVNGRDDVLTAGCVILQNQLERLTEHLHILRTAANPQLSATLSLLNFKTLYTENVDAETVWGQVELLNTKVKQLVDKSMHRLMEDSSNEKIQLLVIDEEDEEQERVEANDSDDDDDDDEDGGEGDDGDAERKRIEARMNRAFQDMEGGSDEGEEEDDVDDDSSEDDGSAALSKRETASLVDPKDFERDRDAVNLHDGFFNLQEMEAFADEEEGYLPDQAFGEVSPDEDNEPADKRSFHQKQRDGDMDPMDEEAHGDDSDEEDDDDDPLVFPNDPVERKRKYRDDEDIDALHKLYAENASMKDEDDAAIHMTAADLFGKPNPTFYERWHSNKRDDFDDSWDSFGKDKSSSRRQKPNWREEIPDDVNNDDRECDASLEKVRDDDVDEEMVPMKDGRNDAKIVHKPFNKQSAKLFAQTEQLEKELLAEKPWQMKGETVSSSRPVNSLLETTPEFEVASKVAPEITVAFTENLEEAIKKRIIAEDWDDVVPRELPDVGWHAKRGEAPEVSQEKSKLSLGELYEREYLKKTSGYDVEAAEKETTEQKAKSEMKSLFANLCSRLDALSNYHFTPRPIAVEAEARVVTQPAIAMEEVLPLHFNSARGSAPEEVYETKRGRDGVLRAESELEQVDRKRLRRAKKASRRKERQGKLADEKLVSRLQPGNGLDNPYEKRKIQQELAMARSSGKVTAGAADSNKYGDSTTFFQRMQKEAQATIQGGSKDAEDVEAVKSKRNASSSFKL
jgi:U3 small nucleolar RNA-associated protein MPP10